MTPRDRLMSLSSNSRGDVDLHTKEVSTGRLVRPNECVLPRVDLSTIRQRFTTPKVTSQTFGLVPLPLTLP